MASRLLGGATRGVTALAVAVLATAGCAGDESAGSETAGSDSTASSEPSQAGQVPWAYEGEGAPEHWADLDESYAACGQGVEQSPIDLASPRTEDLADPTFDYAPATVDVVNNGHTVQVDQEPGGFLVADGDSYELQQFHYHVPSEHTVDGQSFEAELHLVHADPDGNLAVVGVLLTEGTATPGYQPWLDLLDTATEVQTPGGELDPAAFLPQDLSTYRYQGSLTTPPCSEGVEWFVLSTPVELSAAQLDQASEVFDQVSRPVQPLGDRDLILDPAS